MITFVYIPTANSSLTCRTRSRNSCLQAWYCRLVVRSVRSGLRLRPTFLTYTEKQALSMGPLLRYLCEFRSNSSASGKFSGIELWRPPSEWPAADPAAEEEGNRATVLVSKYERSRKNRDACIRAYGAWCRVCELDFAKVYGEIGKGYIHVHHLHPLATLKGKAQKIDPAKDLRPVCPNCHEMLHRSNPPYTIDQLQEIIALSRVQSTEPQRL
jgi:hypothetical protein